MSTWLALHFTHWPLDSQRRYAAGDGGERQIVQPPDGWREGIDAGAALAALGVRPGMALADALAIAPQADVQPRDRDNESRALARLAGWAWQYTSRIHLLPHGEPPALLLEIGASLRLFGGQNVMIECIQSELTTMSYRHCLRVADTPRAALLRARAVDWPAHTRLADLPLACLELPDDVRASLTASGLKHIGEVLALPPATLQQRYGSAALHYLECLTGRRTESLPGYTPPERYRTRLDFDHAIETTEGLRFILHRLFEDMAAFLAGAGAVIQTLFVTLRHEDQPATELRLRLAGATRSAAHLEGVLAQRLSRLTLAAPVVALHLASDRLRESAPDQKPLFADADQPAGDWPLLLDRLRARLGPRAVTWLAGTPSHRPDHATQVLFEPPTQQSGESRPDRPLWLLPEPRPLHENVELVGKAERIETGWWQDGIRRDYYRARDRRGRLLWVYRMIGNDVSDTLYLHGLFG